MFLEFIKQKEAKKFNDDIIEATKGIADLTQIGLDKDEQIFKIVINPEAERAVCFISGLHGNEQGGPYGILAFLQSKFHVPKNKKVIILPLVNPSGFKKGTRENDDRLDINRHFLDDKLEGECKAVWDAVKDENIELLHTLHEDPDLKTFYLYYTHNKAMAKDLVELAKKYFEINGQSEIYGDKMVGGMVPLPHKVSGTIEDKFYKEKEIPYITTETPCKMKLKDRVDFTKNAIKMVINAF